MFRALITTFFVTFPFVSFAQEVPAHTFRILPVGDPPPFIQEVREGVRYEVPPRKGSLPPRELKITLNAKGNAEEIQVIQPRLGRVSSPFTLPATTENKSLSLIADDGSKWLSLSARAAGASLLLTWRVGKDWNQASYMEIPHERLNPHSASVHFANLTNLPIAIVFGEERIRLNPGKHFTRSLQVNASPVSLEILTPDKEGKLTSIYANEVEPLTPSFRVVAIYAADGIRPSQPVKVLNVEEIL